MYPLFYDNVGIYIPLQSEIETERGPSLSTVIEVYRALIIFPMTNQHVAGMDVKVFHDPRGDAFRAYLASKFPDANWNDYLEELLSKFGKRSLPNVSEN